MKKLGKLVRICDKEDKGRGRGPDKEHVAHSGWCGLEGTRRLIQVETAIVKFEIGFSSEHSMILFLTHISIRTNYLWLA
jgi:hypothetical protein